MNPIRSYGWGLDLSGGEQGAGGVGGLLFETFHTGSSAGTYFTTYDGNGNLMSLRNSGGLAAARYEYGPFGETLTSRDVLAGVNPFRFSTKYQDAESGLLYYGYRYYSAGMGRWLSRDPIGESDTSSVYAFVSNGPLKFVDFKGLYGIHLWPVMDKILRIYYRGESYEDCKSDCNKKWKRPPPFMGNDPAYYSCWQDCRDKYLKVPKISYCTRKLAGPGATIWLANRVSSHSFLTCPKDSACLQGHESKGEPPSPEAGFPGTEPKCRPIYYNNPYDRRSYEEVWSCIKNHRLRANYHYYHYNCNTWSSEAMSACGVSLFGPNPF